MPQPPPQGNSSNAVSQESTLVSGPSTLSNPGVKRDSGQAPVRLRKASNAPAASVTIETNDYVAVFSNEGALLTSYQLKKYPNRETHQPIELVNPDPSWLKPFALDYSALPDLNQARFEVEGASRKLSTPGEKAKLVFRYVDSRGLVLEKTFSFINGSYMVDFDVNVSQTGPPPIPASNLVVQWPDILGRDENAGSKQGHASAYGQGQIYRVATLSSGGVDSQKAKKSQESSEIPSPVNWTSLSNQFFAAILIPDPSTGAASAKVVRDTNAYNIPTHEHPN